MNGTSFSHTLAIDLTPPKMTRNVTAARTRPTSEALKLKLVTSASAIALDCTLQPMPNAANPVNNANATPSLGWPIFSRTTIAPPR